MTGFFHFYILRYGIHPKVGANVSMPYDGLFSFLLCTCLLLNDHRTVSMPYDGLFSFLPKPMLKH